MKNYLFFLFVFLVSLNAVRAENPYPIYPPAIEQVLPQVFDNVEYLPPGACVWPAQPRWICAQEPVYYEPVPLVEPYYLPEPQIMVPAYSEPQPEHSAKSANINTETPEPKQNLDKCEKPKSVIENKPVAEAQIADKSLEELENCKSRLNVNSATIAELESKLKSHADKLNKEKADISSETKKENSKLKDTLADKDKQLAALEQKLEELEAELETANDKAKSELTAANDRVQAKDKELEQARSAAKDLQSELDVLKIKAKAGEDNLTQVKADNKTLEDKISKIKTSLKKQTDKNTLLTKTAADLDEDGVINARDLCPRVVFIILCQNLKYDNLRRQTWKQNLI